jgi:hypothetical protein
VDLEFGRKSGLFADFVGGDAVKKVVAFYRDGLEVVGLYGMIAAFPEQVKAVLFQVADEITPFDGHRQGLPTFFWNFS